MYPPTTNRQSPITISRRGFTLTELLVVITIIAMLVALVSVGVMRAMGTAKQTRIKVEVDQLDAAFKAYKEKYGDYPPTNWLGSATGGNPVFAQHIAKAFPRYDQSQLIADIKAVGIDYAKFRPDQALVFWLRGFSADPLHPFVTRDGYQIVNGQVATDTSGNPVVATRTSFFDFDTSRLAYVAAPSPPTYTLPTRPYFSYFPAGSPTDGNGAPYLYWNSRDYGRSPSPTIPEPLPIFKGFNSPPPNGSSVLIFANAGVAVPYWLDANLNNTPDVPPLDNWVNPDSFQIIAAGSDGKYGALPDTNPALTGTRYRVYPAGTNYDVSVAAADDDNVTNFCSKARLGDAKP